MGDTIVFHNQGELDIRAVTTFGLSVKEADSPIGYFGTGLKYAIAVLLRDGCEVSICAGEDRYEFRTAKDKFRGQDFDQIVMDGPDGQVALPFTLELGKNWELWQAYRELYCNAMDEGGNACDKHDDANPKPGYTFVIVTGAKFAEIHRTRNRFINSDEPIFASKGVEVIPTKGVFLKSIRIADSIYRKTLFGYRFQSGVDLTEDRTLKYQHQAEGMIRQAFMACDDFDLITYVLTAEDGTFEEQIDWDHGLPESDVFKTVLCDLYRNQPNKLSGPAKSLAKRLMDGREPTEEIDLSPAQKDACERAVEFLSRHNINIDQYTVKFVRTLGNGIWGRADRGKIFIAAECFDYGVKCLAATLYEEFLHLSKGYRDHTREMQNHLFHTIIGAWEEADGECL